jgi:hypothetical protein
MGSDERPEIWIGVKFRNDAGSRLIFRAELRGGRAVLWRPCGRDASRHRVCKSGLRRGCVCGFRAAQGTLRIAIQLVRVDGRGSALDGSLRESIPDVHFSALMPPPSAREPTCAR